MGMLMHRHFVEQEQAKKPEPVAKDKTDKVEDSNEKPKNKRKNA